MLGHRIAKTFAGTTLALIVVAGAAHPQTLDYVYAARVPLGVQVFNVQPWRSVLTVVASASSPQFKGWRRELYGEKVRLLAADGKPVRYYPDHVDFRITVGTGTEVSSDPPFPLRASLPENDYLLKLRFRVKIFRGLRQTVIEPAEVALIGVPAEMSYNERIYGASFNLPHVPMSERVVLEVLTPQGERLCKFHLDLQ